MPIRKSGSPYWHYDFRLGGRRFRGSCRTRSLRDAKRVEAEARLDALEALTAARPAAYTLSQALGTYLQDIAAGQPSYRTSVSQARSLLAVLPPATPIAELSQADIARFVRHRRAEVANATVNRTLQLLGRALRHMAQVHGAEAPRLDLRGAETREPPERVRALAPAEEARLMAVLDPDTAAVTRFALATGARAGTIRALSWRAIDLEAGRMRFQLKMGGEMAFPLSAALAASLQQLPRAAELPAAAHVFTMAHGDGSRHVISRSGGLWERFRKGCQAADIADFRFHDLRHTFATRMLRQTGNLKLVSRLLGHSSIETTMRYAHVLDEDLVAAVHAYRVD